MNYILPTDDNVHIYGRTVHTAPLPLFWTGSGVEVRCAGSCLWFELEADYRIWEDWIRIEMDGTVIQRCIVPKGRNRICAYRGLDAGQVHTVRLLKETQPEIEDEQRYLVIHGILSDGELLEPEPRACTLEFIGDSITSGEGLAGPAGFVCYCPTVFGLAGHYALGLADALNADFRILSQSGWGVHCSWDNNITHTMPRVYDGICRVVPGSVNEELGAWQGYDFDSWRADVVVINLGSNDGFALDNPPWTDPASGKAWKQEMDESGRLTAQSAGYLQSAVIDFLTALRRKNPCAYLVWTYGMVGHVVESYIEEALQQYMHDSQDKKAGYVSLPELRQEWIGSDNHPNALAHAAAVDILLPKLKEILANQR